MNKETKFKVGDKAHKTKGYKFPCTIVGVFETIKGDIRVVGEMDEYGLLHIFNEDQLDHVEQKGMNKEKYNQIIDELYKNYRSKSNDLDLPENLYNKLIDDLNKDAMFPIDNPNRMLSQEQFINKCKTDSEFSEKWGLKIEERELSLEERMVLCKEKWDYSWNRTINLEDIEWRMNNEWNIPTKLITLTYNNEKIESYE